MNFTALWPRRCTILIILFTWILQRCCISFYCENSVFEHGFNILWWLFLLKYHFFEHLYLRMPGSISRTLCLFTSKAVTTFHDSNRDTETENCQACVKCYYLICYLFWYSDTILWIYPFFKWNIKIHEPKINQFYIGQKPTPCVVEYVDKSIAICKKKIPI